MQNRAKMTEMVPVSYTHLDVYKRQVWQYFTVVPDIKSVGVRDNKRADEWPCVIRAVNTIDAMTASVEELPWPLIHQLTQRITNEVKGINRVLLDVTPKPTGTIEWE